MMTPTSIADRSAKLFFYCLILTAPACGGGGGAAEPGLQPPAAPAGFDYKVPEDRGDTWSVAGAAEQGIAVAALENMMDAILSGEFPAIDSIAIARGGQLVFDETIRTELARNDASVGNSNLAMHAQLSVSKR